MNQHIHLKLVKENIDLKRQGRQDKRGLRTVQPTVHGKQIQTTYNEKKTTFQEKSKVGEDLIFRVIKDSDKPIEFRKVGLKLLAEINKYQAIVKVEDGNLFQNSLTEFSMNKIAKTKAVHYSEFANMEEFVFQTPKEKMGPIISKEKIKPDTHYNLDIQLYITQEGMREIHEKVIEFKNFLLSKEIRVLDDCILPNLVILRVSISGAKILDVLEHNNVYYADFPQKSIYDHTSYRELGFESLPEVLRPSDEAPFIGIIDSGILPTHPLLTGTVYESESFGSLSKPFDENGHGTMVAGIVQYGDVYSTLQGNPTHVLGRYNLLNGRVTDKDNSFPDDKIIPSVINEAIKYFASSEDYECKIFNLSLGDPRTPYQQNSKMDPWSYVLDSLIHEFNLAVVVSSGNYFPSDNNDSVLSTYTDLLLQDEEATIIPPAVSVSSVTVGSLAKDDVPYGLPSRIGHVPIAKKDHISPFSRSGFGYNKSIKPETVAYGGNFSLNILTKRINNQDRNLGIMSTSIFSESWFETRAGTSFSAPYITHLLGQIKQEIPTAKGNLLRSLLIAAASTRSTASHALAEKHKENGLKQKEIKDNLSRLLGYGPINENYLTKSYDHYVTMYHEGQIGIDKVNVFEIPIPGEIYSSRGKTKIHISLAFNPPCRDSRIDYMGTKMSFELYAGLTLDEIKKYTCWPDDDEFNKDRLPKEKEKHKCSLDPALTNIQRGTLLRATHQVRTSGKSSETYGNTYYLVVKCAKRWYEGPKDQEYAVVVSIEHEDENIQLYQPIRTRIESRHRQPTRIRG